MELVVDNSKCWGVSSSELDWLGLQEHVACVLTVFLVSGVAIAAAVRVSSRAAVLLRVFIFFGVVIQVEFRKVKVLI
jgi:hypothetical protein